MTLKERLDARKPQPKAEERIPEWRRRALEAHRRQGWVAAKEVEA